MRKHIDNQEPGPSGRLRLRSHPSCSFSTLRNRYHSSPSPVAPAAVSNIHPKSGAGAASPYLCLSRLVTASTSRAGHFDIPVINRCTNYSRRNLNAGSKYPSLLQYRCNRRTKKYRGRHSATILRPRKKSAFVQYPKNCAHKKGAKILQMKICLELCNMKYHRNTY